MKQKLGLCLFSELHCSLCISSHWWRIKEAQWSFLFTEIVHNFSNSIETVEGYDKKKLLNRSKYAIAIEQNYFRCTMPTAQGPNNIEYFTFYLAASKSVFFHIAFAIFFLCYYEMCNLFSPSLLDFNQCTFVGAFSKWITRILHCIFLVELPPLFLLILFASQTIPPKWIDKNWKLHCKMMVLFFFFCTCAL